MHIQGVIFDLGHTLMGLDGTWPEMFERGAADLAAYVDGMDGTVGRASMPALAWPGAARVAGAEFAQALLRCREEGYARAKETLRETTAEGSMRRTFAHFGVPDPSPELVQGACDAFFAHEEASWSAFPEALPVLRELSARGLRLGLFSNATSDRFIQRLVDRFGFRPYLQPALSSAGVGVRKPDPAALAAFPEAWGVAAGAIVMVGDQIEADVLCAQRAGMRSVWIPSREDARQEGRSPELGPVAAGTRPDRTVAGLVELPRCLEEMARSSGPGRGC